MRWREIKLAVEPGRAVVADLPVKVDGRQDADADVRRRLAGKVIGQAALRRVRGTRQ